MSDFDEWYSEKGEKIHIYREEKWIARHGFKAGQQSQQAKIDELQARIDGAIQALEQSKPNMICQYDAMQALDILKGNKDG